MEVHRDAKHSTPVSAQCLENQNDWLWGSKSNYEISWRNMQNTEGKCLLNPGTLENCDI